MTLQTYLSQDRARALQRGESLPDRARGSALFADISGFTSLTESLRGALGPRRGAEVLAGHLDSVYSTLIADVELYGGSVIDFAGDAILCWFDEDDGPAAPRAIACAFALQRSMRAFREISLPNNQTGELSLKVTVASGPARRLVVGDPAVNFLDALAGATIARTASAEQVARRGDILLDEATVENLGSALAIHEWRINPESSERFAVAEDYTATISPSPFEPVTDLSPSLVRPWINHSVYSRVVTTLGAFLTEFRPCVAMFVRFIGIDFDADNARQQLDEFIRMAQAVAARHDGTLLQVTIGDKGSYAYIILGAISAHEDDERRAVKIALALRENARELGFLDPLQVGITRGVMRIGAYGGATRHTFAALGDDVNLAARLMQTAAPGEILVSGQVQKSTAREFDYEPRAPLSMKGKAEPLPVFAASGERKVRAIRLQEPQYALPMVGRQAELQIIGEKLDLALGGKAQVIGIVAEAGMGKSRLVAEAIRLAHRKGFAGFGGACKADAVNTPYLVWKSIWGAFFDVDPAVPLRKQTRLLEGEIEDRVPERIESLPLLGEMLDIAIPENEFTSALEPKDRKGALSALLEDCLKTAARDEPLLIVLEDMHWIDALSHDLLEELARAAVSLPICFVLAYRPPQLQRLKTPRIEALPGFSKIELYELNPAECEQAIRAKLAQLYPARSGNVPPVLVERLMDRAQGNPFYLEELLNFLRDRGLDPLDPEDMAKIELPDSLHSLILSRIDQLSEHEKTTLRVASIIGRFFRFSWLTGYYPSLGDLPIIKEDLKELHTLDITPLDTPEPELAYLFKHIVTHEVTYESLPYATRANLHEQLAQYLESTYPDEVPIDVLTFHYSMSENQPKKREYYRKSAEAAYRAYANDAALEFYDKALAYSSDPEEAVEIHLITGAILQMQGEWDKSLAHFKDALDIAEKSQLTQKIIKSLIKVGTWQERRGEHHQALEWISKAYDLAVKTKYLEGECDALDEFGIIYWRIGKFEDALEHSHRARHLARELNDKKREASALFMIATINSERGNLVEGKEYFEATNAIDRELNDVRHLASTFLNWGTAYYYQGDYKTSKKLLEDSLNFYREIGEKRGAVIAICNLGNIYYLDADYQTARKYYAEAFGLANNLSDRYMMAISLTSLGITAFMEGHLDEAENHITTAMDLSLALEHRVTQSLLQCYRGLFALSRGQLNPARQGFLAGLQVAHESNFKVYFIYNLIGCACVALAEADPHSATVLLGSSAKYAEAIGLKIEPELLQPYQRTEKAARELLGAEAFQSAWDAGQAMTADEAFAFATKNQAQ